MTDTLYWEFRQVLAELELLPHGTITNYNASGSGEADTREPTGESRPPHLVWRREWEASGDEDGRERALRGARAELTAFREGQHMADIDLETEEQFAERVAQEGEGWTADEVALKCKCTPTFVRRARIKDGRDATTGIKLDDEHPLPVNKMEEARRLLARGLTVRQVSMFTQIPKSTVQDLKKRAA